MIRYLARYALTGLLCGAFAGAALAQEQYNARSSNPTGTQGVTGNPNCPAPVINGITPLNWSCPTGPQSYAVSGSDPQYQTKPPGSYIVPPVGAPGSYIQPETPGSYIVPPQGAPGSYINSTARSGPGGTQVKTGPGGAIILSPGNPQNANEEQGREGPQGVGTGTPASFEPGNRGDIGPLPGGAAANGGAEPYRPNPMPMQGGVMSNGGGYGIGTPNAGGQAVQALFGLIGNSAAQAPKTTPKKTTAKNTAKKPTTNAAQTAAQKAATAQAAKLMNQFINMAGSQP